RDVPTVRRRVARALDRRGSGPRDRALRREAQAQARSAGGRGGLVSFVWPGNLFLVLVVPALIAAYIWAQRRRQRYALRYASLSLVREALGRGPGRKRHIPPALFLLALFFMALGTARPQTTVIVPVQEGTVILALDVSGSMLAEDLKPNRMEAAKDAAKAFVDRQGADVKLGVVAFSGDAQIVQTPTKDH